MLTYNQLTERLAEEEFVAISLEVVALSKLCLYKPEIEKSLIRY